MVEHQNTTVLTLTEIITRDIIMTTDTEIFFVGNLANIPASQLEINTILTKPNQAIIETKILEGISFDKTSEKWHGHTIQQGAKWGKITVHHATSYPLEISISVHSKT